jgi:trehalose 6-phosphate synthase/phosphatase
VGWAGKESLQSAEIPESEDSTSISHELKSSQIVRVFYNDETYKLFYNGMCNASLWPLLHSLPTNTIFRSDYWNAYVDVNKSFSNATLETLKKTNQTNGVKLDNGNPILMLNGENNTLNGNKNGNESHEDESALVWIHDYHLLMMPMMLKNLIEETSIQCRIAFFLHIPFPSWDIFRLNPWANEILLGLLGCDLIAFHTNTYAMNFLECCRIILGSRIDKEEMLVEYGNKIIMIKALPIGIPYDWFEKMAKEAPKSSLCFNKEKVILGVDRLDYTKGIIQRVHGYERFLEKYPEFKEKVVFLQIAVPSRTDIDEYKNLKDELEREVGRVSGRFGTSEWTPIKYIYKSLSQYELASYYRDSAVALITPVRDGMNLVAKEYVACQIDDPGVLIISPFTGILGSFLFKEKFLNVEENF